MQNKKLISGIVRSWSQRLNKVKSKLSDATPEERQELLTKSSNKASRKRRRSSSENTQSGEQQKLRAGQKGFVGRARVPQAITRDYVKRPKNKVEVSEDEEDEDGNRLRAKAPAKKVSRLERMQRKYKDSRSGASRAKHHAKNVQLSANC